MNHIKLFEDINWEEDWEEEENIDLPLIISNLTIEEFNNLPIYVENKLIVNCFGKDRKATIKWFNYFSGDNYKTLGLEFDEPSEKGDQVRFHNGNDRWDGKNISCWIFHVNGYYTTYNLIIKKIL